MRDRILAVAAATLLGTTSVFAQADHPDAFTDATVSALFGADMALLDDAQIATNWATLSEEEQEDVRVACARFHGGGDGGGGDGGGGDGGAGDGGAGDGDDAGGGDGADGGTGGDAGVATDDSTDTGAALEGFAEFQITDGDWRRLCATIESQ